MKPTSDLTFLEWLEKLSESQYSAANWKFAGEKKAASHEMTGQEIMAVGRTVQELAASVIQAGHRLKEYEAGPVVVKKNFVLHQAMKNIFAGLWELRDRTNEAIERKVDDAGGDINDLEVQLKYYNRMLEDLDPFSAVFKEIRNRVEEIHEQLNREEEGIPHWSDWLTGEPSVVSEDFASEREPISQVRERYVHFLKHHQKERQDHIRRVEHKLELAGITHLYQLLELSQAEAYSLIGSPTESPVFHAFLDSYGYSWKYRGRAQLKYPSHRFEFSEKMLRKEHESKLMLKLLGHEFETHDTVRFVLEHSVDAFAKVDLEHRVCRKWLIGLHRLVDENRIFPRHIVVNEKEKGRGRKFSENIAAAIINLVDIESRAEHKDRPEPSEYGDVLIDLNRGRMWTDAFVDCHYFKELVSKHGVPGDIGMRELNTKQFLQLITLVIWEWYASIEKVCFASLVETSKSGKRVITAAEHYAWITKEREAICWDWVGTEEAAPKDLVRLLPTQLRKTHTPSEQSD